MSGARNRKGDTDLFGILDQELLVRAGGTGGKGDDNNGSSHRGGTGNLLCGSSRHQDRRKVHVWGQRNMRTVLKQTGNQWKIGGCGMTENEAIEELKECVDLPYGNEIRGETAEAAIAALEEIQRYRELGTVEELAEMGKPDEIKALINRLNTVVGVLHAKLLPYEKLGTVEELREAREKQVAKKPVTYPDTNRADCPVCGSTVRGISRPFGNYCSKCGQAIDWSEKE